MTRQRRRRAMRRLGQTSLTRRRDVTLFKLSGTLPPFSASFCITALWRATFSSAVPSAPTWTLHSLANCLRASRLESRSRSFRRSTIDVCQLPPPPFCEAIWLSTASTIYGSGRWRSSRNGWGGWCRWRSRCRLSGRRSGALHCGLNGWPSGMENLVHDARENAHAGS